MAFNSERNVKKYKAGIYGPRYVCTRVSECGLANTSFVSDMSSGFSCNLGYKIPNNWAFDQFYEMNFSSNPTFAIDKDAYSGRDKGFKKFDTVLTKTDEEIEAENLRSRIEIARKQYVYNVMQPLGFLEPLVEAGVSFKNDEITLLEIDTPEVSVEVTSTINTSFVEPAECDFSFLVSLDNEGNLTQSCQTPINEIATEIGHISELGNINNFEETLKNIACSVKQGYISFEINFKSVNSAEFSIIATTPNLLPEDETLEAEMSVTLTVKITFNDGNNRFNEAAFSEAVFTEENLSFALKAAAVGAVILIAIAIGPANIITAIMSALSTLASSIGGFALVFAV